jgi:hypothetical protein
MTHSVPYISQNCQPLGRVVSIYGRQSSH